MSKKLDYRELAKNDPNFHDIRAKILLEASHCILKHAHEVPEDQISGVTEAAVELRRMASNARRAHKKLQDERREQRRGSDAKAKAFGFGD
jgi:hypothetical protein